MEESTLHKRVVNKTSTCPPNETGYRTPDFITLVYELSIEVLTRI